MRLAIFRTYVFWACLLLGAATAQTEQNSPSHADATSVTVPITIDHNQILIGVDLQQADGSTTQVHGLITNANPDLSMSQRVAEMLGVAVHCTGAVCTGTPKSDASSLAVYLGGIKILLRAANEIKIPAGNSKIVPGTDVEITLSSNILRNYDMLVDFPDRKLTLAKPGALHFKGVSTKIQVNASNGIIQVPGKIEDKKYNLLLNLAAPISWLSGDLFEKLALAHPDWPRMTGAVGPANLTGIEAETKLKLVRLDRLQFGSLYLTDVPVAEIATDIYENQLSQLQATAGSPIAGLIGSDILVNYRVGIDYAHSVIYFDIGRTFRFPEFDVVGLTLRPESGGRFVIVGIAEFEGKTSVPGVQIGDYLTAVDEIPVSNSTLGQVWSMLGGSPGQERTLTIERAGKQLMVVANVRHFLGAAPEDDEKNTKRK
jgi:hypothetical protein